MNSLRTYVTVLMGLAVLVSPQAGMAQGPSYRLECDTTISLSNSPSLPTDGDMLTITEDVTVSLKESRPGGGVDCPLNVDDYVNTGSLQIFQVKAGNVGVPCNYLKNICYAGDSAKIGQECAIDEDCGSSGECNPTKACSEGLVGQLCNDNPDCNSSPRAKDGVCSPVGTEGNLLGVEPPPLPTDGTLSVTFDTTGLGGNTLGFLATYSGNFSQRINGAANICRDVEICDSGALITVKLTSGPEAPLPNTTNDWQYEVTVEACKDLTGVTAQGGTNGWAPLKNRLSSDQADSALHPSDPYDYASVRNPNKKNEIILWQIGDMSAGDKVSLLVDLGGSIPKNAPDCQLRYLSGPWSTTFSIDGGASYQKSDYTDRVYIFVTTDGDSSNCSVP